MIPPTLASALRRISADLRELDIPWALAGGMAFQVLVEARTTRDVDLVVSVAGNREAESLFRELTLRGYRSLALVEQEATGRIATIRLIPPGGEAGGVLVDLLFASSGIEAEIAISAIPIQILTGLTLPVIRREHLLALKVLAGRPRDLEDAAALLRILKPDEILRTRDALDLIDRRGFHRNKDLERELEKLLSTS